MEMVLRLRLRAERRRRDWRAEAENSDAWQAEAAVAVGWRSVHCCCRSAAEWKWLSAEQR